MQALLLSFILACVGIPAWAAGDQAAPSTVTAQVMGLQVALDDILITPKQGYAHLLWDSYPSRASLRAHSIASAPELP